jgi:hypothetical protein
MPPYCLKSPFDMLTITNTATCTYISPLLIILSKSEAGEYPLNVIFSISKNSGIYIESP